MAPTSATGSPDPFIVDDDVPESQSDDREKKADMRNSLSDLTTSAGAEQAQRMPTASDSQENVDSAFQQQAQHDTTEVDTDIKSTSSTAQKSERGSQTNSMQSSTYVDPSTSPPLGDGEIQIVDAQKTSDGVGASTYIAYLIQCGILSAKRRYSEFASLRDALVMLHPTLIIPPIPSKHSLTDYAARQAKAKEDATIVARRKRMLQVFLNRIKDHEKLNRSAVFRRFLDGRWSWHEITSSPPLSMLPKSNLRAPAADPASPHASPAYLALPLPPANGTSPLKNPNQRFADSEAFTERFRNHLQGSLEKTNRRVAKRWTEASSDYAELGAVLNEFSLSESGSLASAIERTGQSADSTFMAIGNMLHDWEIRFTEPLNEYAQFASVLQKLLRWRHQKHLQYELAEDALEAKRLQLDELERIEAEANRLNRALETGGRGLVPSSSSVAAGPRVVQQSREGVWDSVNSRASTMRKSVYGSAAETEASASEHPAMQNERLVDSEEWTEPSLTGEVNGTSASAVSPPTATNGGNEIGGPSSRQQAPAKVASQTRHTKRVGASGSYGANSGGGGGGGGGGLLGAISQTFHSVMDVDPEATRRNTISRLKDSCAQLEEALELTARDLRFATLTIQADLDKFQRQKIRDLRAMAIAFAEIHRDFCRANLESWKEAKQEIDAITEQTPLPESSLIRR